MDIPIPKKVIEFGWASPGPAYIRDHIREMERRPFDGIIFALPTDVGAGRIFHLKTWGKARENPARFDKELKTLSEIAWDKFTDNFIVLYGASDMDWFSDDDWEQGLANLRFVAKCAVVAKCVGLCWDPEPYGGNPWVYAKQPHASEKSYDDYRAMVRKRGAQFMQVIAEEMPHCKLLSMRMLSDFADGSPFSNRAIAELDPDKRAKLIENAYFGLHPEFINGLLDAVPPTIVMFDGNEDAYYYTSKLDFYWGYHMIRQRVLPLVAPENHAKYRAHMLAGNAIYMDYIFGQMSALYHFPLHLPRMSRMLSPEERAKWYEHNVYYGLTTSDEYVWMWDEEMDWWRNTSVPPGMEDAIASAKRKVHAGEPLGFDVEGMLLDAQHRAKEECEAQRVKGRAIVARLPNMASLQPFTLAMNSWLDADKIGPTNAKIGYDDEALHLYIQCLKQPHIDPRAFELAPNLDIWRDDNLEIFVNTAGSANVHHFKVNPRTGQQPAEAWQATAQVRDDEWAAEVSIPWRTLGVQSPQPGMQLRANLCRNRAVYNVQNVDNWSQALAHQREPTSWSQVFIRFDEPEHFGVLALE